jgi:predicted DNA-binding protein
MLRVEPKRTSRLLQTVVKPTVLRQLDALARATGHTRASYLRHLVELHVKAINPRLAKALARTDQTRGMTPT